MKEIRRTLTVSLCVLCALCGEARAQKPDGYAWVGVDALPNAAGAPIELRARLFVEEKLSPFEHLTLRAAGSLDVLGFRRPAEDARDLTFVPYELHAELTGSRADLRLGYSRIVWGRLDEIQPTDVVNPLDLARFFFDGRSEARLGVPMVRGRVFFGERATIEALIVPVFRRGRFDLLSERTSPFGSVTVTLPPRESVTVTLLRQEPGRKWGNVQGGGRFSATTGRVDWAISAYRGFDAFGSYLPLETAILQVFPRYTMIGGDFETTKGQWALRGEVARFSGGVDGVDGGVGFDRKAGEFRLSGTLFVHQEAAGACAPPNPVCAAEGGLSSYTATSLVGAADRSFARERYRTRTFGVYNVTEGVTFLRNITSMEVRANVTLEGSIGWFVGTRGLRARRDLIRQFSDRDFLYARLRVHF